MSESTVLCQKCRRAPDDPEHLRHCDCDCSQLSATTVVSRVVELRIRAATTDSVIEQLGALAEEMKRGEHRAGRGVGRHGTSTFAFEWKDIPSD